MLGFVYISLSNKTGIVLGIVSNLQTGVVWTFKILFVVDDYGIFFGPCSFINAHFSVFIAAVNGIIFLISLLNRSLLVYKN